MKVEKINLENPDQKIIHQAACVIKKGGVVIYPTDTTYGLGASAYNKKAVEAIYKIKKRGKSKPLSVIVSGIAMIRKLVDVNPQAKILIDKFLPGPLTIILPKKEGVLPIAPILTAGQSTLGFRIPKNKVTSSLVRKLELPYTTTSVNLSGSDPLYSSKDILGQFKNTEAKPDLFLDAGDLSSCLISTIVDLSVTPPKILREGQIKKEEIQKLLQ